MAKHQGTLDNYGLDPTDPQAIQPVSFDISVSTYGSYWRFVSGKGGNAAIQAAMMLDKSAYDYKVFSGNAPDAFGAYVPFGFESYYLWFRAAGDVVVDYTVNNVNPLLIIQGNRQYILPLSVHGFRIRNSALGANVPYQLVVYI
jgi:hypothetical protein